MYYLEQIGVDESNSGTLFKALTASEAPPIKAAIEPKAATPIAMAIGALNTLPIAMALEIPIPTFPKIIAVL